MKQKGLLLLLAALSVFVLMSQRPSRRYPSPADPGMDIQTPPKKNGTGGPESPISDEQDDMPVSDDPNSGDTPDIDENDDENFPIEDDKPSFPKPREDGAQLKRFEIARIAAGSAFGNAGDWVFLVYGEGFISGEEPPVLHLGDSMVFKEVFVNPQGTELYAIMPAEVASTLSLREFKHIAVQNPGGYNRNPLKWARLAVSKPELLQALQSATSTTFRHGPYFMERVK